MSLKRIATLTVVLLGMTGLLPTISAQQLISAEVELDVADLSLSEAEGAEGLREYVRRLSESYAPDVRLSMTPIEPVEVSLLLRLTAGSADRYLADLTLTAYRPIYGKEERSTLLVATERALPIEMSQDSGFLPIPGAIPESMIGRRLYYYLTLAMMLYYDSFDTLGGQPFMDHLRLTSDRLSSAWSDSDPLTSAPLSPMRLLPELERPEGTRMRELYCLYHREVLDEPLEARAELSLLYFLRETNRLREGMHTPRLLQLVSETKQRELSRWLDRPALTEEITELVPWIR